MYIVIEIDEPHGQAYILAYGEYEHCKTEAVKYAEIHGLAADKQQWFEAPEPWYEWLVWTGDGKLNIHIRSATIPFGRVGDDVELLWLKK